jgi:cytochrome P450 family 3 subfamily A
MNVSEIISSLKSWLESYVDVSVLSKIPTWVYIFVPTVYVAYKYATWNFGVFKKLGINGPRPWPIVGTSWTMITRGLVEHDMSFRKYGSVVGTFQGRTPILMIFDVEILKQILIKDFSNFTNRFPAPFTDYPVRKMLTVLQGDNWKHVRNILTPTFSSGKLRKMNKQIQKCSETFMANLLDKAEKNEIFDFREICGAFTMDVIASTAFSVQIDSHNDPNNKFVTMGKKAFMFRLTSPKLLVFFFFPFLVRPLSKLGISIFDSDVTQFFVDVIHQLMDQRNTEETKKSVDFLQLMMDSSEKEETGEDVSKDKWTSDDKSENSKPRGLTHEELLAQGFLFFLAGFETTANTLSLLAYSLATHPECQEKLIKEIDEVTKENAEIDYDVVNKMTYLDMCLSETLRLYPAGPRTDRVCGSDTTINGVFIPKGMTIVSPIYVLHMDPEVWPNPTEFNPERFTAEAKEARNPYYYMPFGVGPRNCVGMRLALTELKMAAATILQRMKFVKCEETQVPLKLNKISMKGENGIKIRMEKRQK